MQNDRPKLPDGLPDPTWKDDEFGIALYRGDCLDILPQLPDGCFDSAVTDPPYGMAFRSNYRIEKHTDIANDGNDRMLQWACKLHPSHSNYVFCRWNNIPSVPPPRSVITWVKNNWSMGDLEHEHARQTENVLFYPGARHCWPIKRPADVVFAPRTGNDLHPSEKPLSLMEQVCDWCGHTILDPFMGSGTTGVACVRLGRAFIGIELEPRYFDICVDRISKAITEWQGGPMFATHEPAGLFDEQDAKNGKAR